ncbi:type I restriction-modification system subunit M N-terminal domain-containing protein [Actinopolymorpha sp. B11F2]|uniref:type I restriction-modification system subunit M N-terminal domain-containing protein n=1 Tax=Actinopolymorpha sp. B11F2 TaxID=3160862 RepID=UPI0032E46DA7
MSLEATLRDAADRLRSRVDAAGHKHVVFGMIFLKFVSDVFATRCCAPFTGQVHQVHL